MRLWNSPLALVLAAGGALAVVGSVLVVGGIVEAAVLALIIAVLAGMYQLRRYARRTLIYNRLRSVRASAADGAPGTTADARQPDRQPWGNGRTGRS